MTSSEHNKRIFSAHPACLAVFVSSVLLHSPRPDISDQEAVGLVIQSLKVHGDGSCDGVDYRTSLESLLRPPAIPRPLSTASIASSASSFVLPSLYRSSSSSSSSSWTSFSSVAPPSLLFAQSPRDGGATLTFKPPSPERPFADGGHNRSASGAIIESYGLPLEAFTFPDPNLARLANALVDGVSLDDGQDSDSDSARDDDEVAQDEKHDVRKDLIDYDIISVRDAEDIVDEDSWRASDATKSLKALGKFARGREWLLERPNLFPTFHPRVAPSRLPCFTPVSTNADDRTSPPHRSRLHLLTLPTKVSRLITDFLEVKDLVRLSAVCIHLRGFILTVRQPRFKQHCIELGWPLVPEGLVSQAGTVKVQERKGAMGEVATFDSPEHGDWLLYLHDVHHPWISSKSSNPSNTTAASTLSRRRTHELSLRILAVAQRNLDKFPPILTSPLLSSFPLPPLRRPPTLNLSLTDPALARRPPTLPATAIPSPRLSLSETEFVITTPRSPLPSTPIPIRVRAPTLRPTSRPRGGVFQVDIPTVGHLLPTSSTPSFEPSQSQAEKDDDDDEEILLPPRSSYTNLSWDRSFDDGADADVDERSPISPFIASDAGTGFSICSTPPVKLRRRLFEAVVGSGER